MALGGSLNKVQSELREIFKLKKSKICTLVSLTVLGIRRSEEISTVPEKYSRDPLLIFHYSDFDGAITLTNHGQKCRLKKNLRCSIKIVHILS